jgi:hypothetical protein
MIRLADVRARPARLRAAPPGGPGDSRGSGGGRTRRPGGRRHDGRGRRRRDGRSAPRRGWPTPRRSTPAGRPIGGRKGYSPFVPTSHLPGASTQPAALPCLRQRLGDHRPAAGRRRRLRVGHRRRHDRDSRAAHPIAWHRRAGGQPVVRARRQAVAVRPGVSECVGRLHRSANSELRPAGPRARQCTSFDPTDTSATGPARRDGRRSSVISGARSRDRRRRPLSGRRDGLDALGVVPADSRRREPRVEASRVAGLQLDGERDGHRQ